MVRNYFNVLLCASAEVNDINEMYRAEGNCILNDDQKRSGLFRSLRNILKSDLSDLEFESRLTPVEKVSVDSNDLNHSACRGMGSSDAMIFSMTKFLVALIAPLNTFTC